MLIHLPRFDEAYEAWDLIRREARAAGMPWSVYLEMLLRRRGVPVVQILVTEYGRAVDVEVEGEAIDLWCHVIATPNMALAHDSQAPAAINTGANAL